ncbi:hypothetical protein DERP_014492 [Dermatophagoides pteronyssinus]|uniref:Uncharacterized protein n=1 Tax=Dermatophagoides pteronyssinus TaxID=6956 RepID=A0ABQ8IV98_DERPT|nr:hypothetical protein DERP_014492 [Dermatophagoides pteronyssinus]
MITKIISKSFNRLIERMKKSVDNDQNVTFNINMDHWKITMNFIHRLTIIDTIDISDKFFNQIQTNYQIAKTFDKNLKARPIKRKFNDKHELVNALKRLRNRTINEVKCNQHDKIFSGFTDLFYHITEYRTVNDWIAAMDMLQEFINGQRFIDFSIGEYRWNSMLTFIEQMMMIANKANEMPNVRLSDKKFRSHSLSQYGNYYIPQPSRSLPNDYHHQNNKRRR